MNPFFGQSRVQLETWLADAQSELATGKTITAWSGEDSHNENQAWRQLHPERRIVLLFQELNRQYPIDYPIQNTLHVSRTKAAFG